MRLFRAGFTLVELIVVVAIIGVVMTASIAGYNTFNQQQILVTAGKQLLLGLHQAQSNARSGVKPAAGCAANAFEGYTVNAAANATSYTVTARCAGALVAASAKTYPFSGGVKVQSAFTITFLGQLGGVNGIAGTNMDITLLPTSGTKKYVVNVTTQGAISDMGVQ